ncbi:MULTISPECIES: D-arabinono-1,4-lactone oxidase [Moorena]|uniref:FAD/FMN-containing dehydrogenase n=1 Tax=Moorena producens 3L TaxID=489825 RepID=F4XSQ2_9CYAN|nr:MULTISPECIES: D-arabinono-1,4-lactone oxidase [Moorena]NEQ15253.1 FAD-binding protein [Moorena sp. SIO3E2]NES85043.1 FAD-binding protein [Moorena sp. SIO2B7]EGJ32377.1 FAD/FMN-containing dehydrogenase [Moorena producens 3L]NEP36035.1 FAD-binding protein [Moorena sp. SIO3B2]NEP68587.1 FAD-binding protein [Moorena sp. SIO3A5]
MSVTWSNWRGNVSCNPKSIVEPSSNEDLRKVLAMARTERMKVKVVGSGHSWSEAACTDGVLVSLKRLNRVIELDRERGTVTVEPGITLNSLNQYLDQHGMALENLGAITKQTISGAIAMATHGTGDKNGSLASAVVELELMKASGEVVRYQQDNPTFYGVCVNLGALGIITRLTLRCVPTFFLRDVQQPMLTSVLRKEIDTLVKENDHFQFFEFPHTSRSYWFKFNKMDEPVTPMPFWRQFLDDLSRTISRSGNGIGDWITRNFPALIPIIFRVAFFTNLRGLNRWDKSFKILAFENINFTYSELEYAIPRSATIKALEQIHEMIKKQGFRINLPISVRFASSEEHWLSPLYQRESAYISLNLSGSDFKVIENYHREAEKILLEYGGRPNWGKHFYSNREYLRSQYPRWDDFALLMKEFDPDRLFSNPFLDRLFPFDV